MKIFPRRLMVGIGVLALAGTMAACGSSGGDEEATKDGQTKVQLGNFPNSILTLPIAVSVGEGIFEEEGLSVELVTGKSGPELIAALIGGTTQVAAASSGTAFPALGQGQDLKLLPPFQREDKTITASVKSGINDLDGLKGKKIAVPVRGGDAETFAVDVLKSFDINPKDVTFVATGAPSTMAVAVVQGEADAVVGTPSTVALVRAQGEEVKVLANSIEGSAGARGENGIASFYVTTAEYQKEHPETVNKVCRALTSAADWIADPTNKDAVVDYVAEWVNVSEESATEIYELEREAWSDNLSETKWKQNLEFAGIEKPISYNHVLNDCG